MHSIFCGLFFYFVAPTRPTKYISKASMFYCFIDLPSIPDKEHLTLNKQLLVLEIPQQQRQISKYVITQCLCEYLEKTNIVYLIFSVRFSMVSLLTLKFMFSFSVMIFQPILPVTDFRITNVTHSPLTGSELWGFCKIQKSCQAFLFCFRTPHFVE